MIRAVTRLGIGGFAVGAALSLAAPLYTAATTQGVTGAPAGNRGVVPERAVAQAANLDLAWARPQPRPVEEDSQSAVARWETGVRFVGGLLSTPPLTRLPTYRAGLQVEQPDSQSQVARWEAGVRFVGGLLTAMALPPVTYWKAPARFEEPWYPQFKPVAGFARSLTPLGRYWVAALAAPAEETPWRLSGAQPAPLGSLPLPPVAYWYGLRPAEELQPGVATQRTPLAPVPVPGLPPYLVAGLGVQQEQGGLGQSLLSWPLIPRLPDLPAYWVTALTRPEIDLTAWRLANRETIAFVVASLLEPNKNYTLRGKIRIRSL